MSCFNRIAMTLVLFSAALPSCAWSQTNECQTQRMLTINFTLTGVGTELLKNVPIGAQSLTGTVGGTTAYTNEAGQIEFPLYVCTNDTEIIVYISKISPGAPLQFGLRDKVTVFDLYTQYAVEGQVIVPLVAGDDTYSVTIQAHESVTATGRAVKAGGIGVEALIGTKGVDRIETADNQGIFSSAGIRRGASSTIFIWPIAMNTAQVFARDLSAVETAGSPALGDVVLDVVDANCAVDLTVTNRFSTIRAPFSNNGFLCLVRDDGAVLYDFSITDDNKVAAPGLIDLPEQVAAGRYYVVPGTFMKPRYPTALYDLVKTGRQADLDAAGAITITATEGGTVAATIDAAAAEHAVRRVVDGVP